MTKSFEQRTAFYLSFDLAFHLENARYYYESKFDNSLRKNQWKQHMAKADALRELALTIFDLPRKIDAESLLTELNTIATGIRQERIELPLADVMFEEYI